MCYPASWLDAKAENDAKGRTNREVQNKVNGPVNKVDHTNTLQAIYGACSCDTDSKTTRGYLADVGCLHAPRAARATRSDIQGDSQGVDLDG